MPMPEIARVWLWIHEGSKEAMMQKADALAQIDAIIDDLSNGELFDAVGEAGYLLLREALEVVRLALQGCILSTESHQHILMDIINQQLANPPDEHMN